MCRVALWNKKAEEMLENKIGLKSFLDYLERSFGGHGNGFALLLKNGTVKIRKGVKLDTKDIVDMITKVDYEWCLFHTRIASVSSVCDKNCHPFQSGNKVLAMNGTETGFSTMGKLLGNITDTEAIVKTIAKFKLPMVETVLELNSVFMGFDDGVPFVATGGKYSDLEVMYEDKAICFASEFPYTVVSYEPADRPFFWQPAKPIQVVEVNNSSKNNKYNSYLTDYDDWGHRYDVSTASKTTSLTNPTTPKDTNSTNQSTENKATNNVTNLPLTEQQLKVKTEVNTDVVNK